jgi:hypothetical protein
MRQPAAGTGDRRAERADRSGTGRQVVQGTPKKQSPCSGQGVSGGFAAGMGCGSTQQAEASNGTFRFTRRSCIRQEIECVVYPWPFGEFDNVMDEALDMAMDYLVKTEQATNFKETQASAASAIATAWRSGVRNRLRLCNLAIRAVETKDNLHWKGR